MIKNKVDDFVDDKIFDEIIDFLQANNCSGIPFFKDNYLKRRIYLRALALKFQSLDDYFDYLKNNISEIKVFDDIITINVSYFFRNIETYNVLKDSIIPSIFQKKAKRGEKFFKVLCIGCASGEEAYSLGILFNEYFAKDILFIRPYILGIDYDYNSIVQARIGVYDEQKLENVPQELLKYFEKVDNRKYIISHNVKKMIVFRHEDVFKSDIKKYWDIIFCRNMLIYLNLQAQEELLKKVHSICINEGYLVLGKSETLPTKARSLFSTLYIKERIYQKRSDYESKS
ncbi:MAG: protein-glutamate O-methyltransferase CheR [Proteobacteria bacterium]|nr:protein-glutamate O-methyltransferase CheR [Pseudomonadota bacterium]